MDSLTTLRGGEDIKSLRGSRECNDLVLQVNEDLFMSCSDNRETYGIQQRSRS